MGNMMKSFTTRYKRMGKHGKKCEVCGKLLQGGEPITMRQVIVEKYYPVKGIMRFASWKMSHEACDKGVSNG